MDSYYHFPVVNRDGDGHSRHGIFSYKLTDDEARRLQISAQKSRHQKMNWDPDIADISSKVTAAAEQSRIMTYANDWDTTLLLQDRYRNEDKSWHEPEYSAELRSWIRREVKISNVELVRRWLKGTGVSHVYYPTEIKDYPYLKSAKQKMHCKFGVFLIFPNDDKMLDFFEWDLTLEEMLRIRISKEANGAFNVFDVPGMADLYSQLKSAAIETLVQKHLEDTELIAELKKSAQADSTAEAEETGALSNTDSETLIRKWLESGDFKILSSTDLMKPWSGLEAMQ